MTTNNRAAGAPASVRAGKSAVWLGQHRLPLETVVLLLTIALWIALSLSSPVFFTHENILNIMRQASISAIIAFGVLFTIVIAGIDLSVGSVAALVGIITAQLLKADVAIPLALCIGMAIGVLIGIINALGASKLGIPAFIVTLAGLQAYRGLALLATGGQSIGGMPPALTIFVRGSMFGLPNLFWTMALLGVSLHYLLSATRTGRYCYAVGSNIEAARRVGINITHINIVAYTISSGMAAIAGLLLIGRLNVATPTAAFGWELTAIASVVVGGASLFGGRGTIPGTFIGSLLFVTLGNGANLLGVDPFWEMVIAGLLIAAVVYLDNLQKRRQAGLS
jgi:ribose transport system permease protein